MPQYNQTKFLFYCSIYYILLHMKPQLNQPARLTQPGHPSVSRRNEYQPMLCGREVWLVFGGRQNCGSSYNISYLSALEAQLVRLSAIQSNCYYFALLTYFGLPRQRTLRSRRPWEMFWASMKPLTRWCAGPASPQCGRNTNVLRPRSLTRPIKYVN